MSSIKDKLKQAKRRTATEKVCLRGDLAGEHEQLQVQLEQLQAQLEDLPKSSRLGGDPERQRIAAEMEPLRAEMERLRAEMEDSTIEFTFKALSDVHYQRLLGEHPPRREGDGLHPSDDKWLFNWSTFPAALIRACTVEPTLDAEDWELLFGDDGLSPGQTGQLRSVVLAVNGRSVDVPFSPAASNGNPS